MSDFESNLYGSKRNKLVIIDVPQTQKIVMTIEAFCNIIPIRKRQTYMYEVWKLNVLGSTYKPL